MYDAPAAKQLLSSKKFDYIQTGPLIFGNFEDVHIDTRELKLPGISLGKILKAEHIKVNTLIMRYSEEGFKDSLLTIDVKLVFIFYLYITLFISVLTLNLSRNWSWKS